MNKPNYILVVAPDQGLRRSLEFALEVEGFDVVSFEDLTTALTSPRATDGMCVVVDEEALFNDPLAAARIQGFKKPTFLLIDRSRSVPEALDIHILRKPVLGNALITAVRGTEGTT